jgi:hypothetical protein
MNKSVKKTKFIDTTNIEYNKQPFYEINPNYSSQINLLKQNYNNKDKMNLTLNNNLNPNDYNLNYYNSNNVVPLDNYFQPLLNLEPGRGFGNLNINNEIRNGKSSRSDIEDFKINRESDVTNRFNIIDTKYLNSYNTTIPFPVSGRKINT